MGDKEYNVDGPPPGQKMIRCRSKNKKQTAYHTNIITL